MRNLFDDAHTALTQARERDVWFGDREPAPPPPPVEPEAMARHLATMLEITSEQVGVDVSGEDVRGELDATRDLAVVFEVLPEQVGSPHNTADQRLRLAPVPGHETTAFVVQGYCRDCQARDAEVAVITNLAELGFFLHVNRAPRNALWPLISRGAGHYAHCVWMRRATLTPTATTPITPTPTPTVAGDR